MRKILVTLAVTLLSSLTQAAIPDMKFRRLDTRDGLSNSQVICTMQDSKGYVWIGTPYGLNRYDGYRVKTFYSDPRDTTSLRSNYVDGIFEAGDGRLWLKQGMSYSIFNPATEKCDRHPERWFEAHGILGGIEHVYIDNEKDMWVKTYVNTFCHYNARTGKVTQLPMGYGPDDFPLETAVSSFAERGKELLISTVNGEIITVDKEKDKITGRDTYLSEQGLASNQDCKLRIDRSGNLWILAIGRTFVYDAKARHWYHSAQEALRAWGFADVPDEMEIWDVKEDGKQLCWFATDRGGLYVADMKTKAMRQFKSDKHDETTISDNTLRCLFVDRHDRVWIGSYMNGLNLFAGNTSTFRNLELGVVNTVCFDRHGYTWLGTNDEGIKRYNNKTGETVVYNRENSGIASNTMVGSLVSSDGSVWFGTYEGGLIHIKDGYVTNIRATGDTLGLANNNVWTVCEDQYHNIWLGLLGGGVQRIDHRTGRFTTFRMGNSILPTDYISTITRTKKGWLMVTHSKYYSLINPKTMHIVNYNLTELHPEMGLTEATTCGIEDSRELAWLGTTSGAIVFDRKSGRVWQLDMRSGLFGSSVNGIAEDDSHTVWLVTDHGVSNVVPQRQDDGSYTFIVRSYNNRDGLQNGPYNQRSICVSTGGFVMAGGHGGLDILNPKNMGKERMKEVPVFSGLQVFDQDIEVGQEVDGRVILDEVLNNCRQLRLRYYQPFTIQLASSSGEIHNRSRFVYRLEGFNDNWVKTSELNPNITYMSLPTGTYTLCVRMLNDNGTIGDDESRIDITILPPFYRSWWAVLLYILLGCCLAFLWYRRTVRRHSEHIALEHQRRELEKQQWMSEMRAQMAQQPQWATPKQEEQLLFRPTTNELVGFVKQHVEEFRLPDGHHPKLSFHSSLNRFTMSFDPALLSRMMDILLNNAVKFSPQGSRIRISMALAGNNMAEIRVADRGLGIPEEARAHMFDAAADAGIGLNTVKRIVDLHRGNVSTADNPDGGTIFVIQLSADLPMPASTEPAVEDAVLMD